MKKLRAFIRTNPKTSLALLVAIGVALAVLIPSLWQSEADRAEGIVTKAVKAFEQGDVDATMAYLTPDYSFNMTSREDLARMGRKAIEVYGPPNVQIVRRSTAVSGGLAVCTFNMVGWPTKGRGTVGRNWFRTEWQFTLVKREGRWYVSEIVPLVVEGKQLGTVRALYALLGLGQAPAR